MEPKIFTLQEILPLPFGKLYTAGTPHFRWKVLNKPSMAPSIMGRKSPIHAWEEKRPALGNVENPKGESVSAAT